MSEPNYNEGFNAGYMQLQLKDVEEATPKLWAALGINNRVSFLAYKTGKIEPKASQVVKVEAVFKEYGITENIWGK